MKVVSKMVSGEKRPEMKDPKQVYPSSSDT